MKYTIEDLSQGRVVLEYDMDDLTSLRSILKKAFPRDESHVSGMGKFYFANRSKLYLWDAAREPLGIPSQKLSDFIKSEEMSTQKLKRRELINLYNLMTCKTWKDCIMEILNLYPLLTDDSLIEIPQKYIDLLNKEGNKEQKQLVEELGIVLTKETLVDTNFINNYLNIRLNGEYTKKAIFLSNFFNWELKKDSTGQMCLIPIKK